MGRKAYAEQVGEKQMVSDDPQVLRASKTLAPVLLGSDLGSAKIPRGILSNTPWLFFSMHLNGTTYDFVLRC